MCQCVDNIIFCELIVHLHSIVQCFTFWRIRSLNAVNHTEYEQKIFATKQDKALGTNSVHFIKLNHYLKAAQLHCKKDYLKNWWKHVASRFNLKKRKRLVALLSSFESKTFHHFSSKLDFISTLQCSLQNTQSVVNSTGAQWFNFTLFTVCLSSSPVNWSELLNSSRHIQYCLHHMLLCIKPDKKSFSTNMNAI